MSTPILGAFLKSKPIQLTPLLGGERLLTDADIRRLRPYPPADDLAPRLCYIMSDRRSAEGKMEKPFVLIVEDERDIAALFRHVMDLAGYHTEIASNGQLAMERLATCVPDIVLLDLSLPGISGVNILHSFAGRSGRNGFASRPTRRTKTSRSSTFSSFARRPRKS